MKAILAIEDGIIFEGESFGASGERVGEIVFNTSMCGYQEILTDPSYKGQIVVMTYPLIGNYGVNKEDFESSRIWVEGFVVREYSELPSNWRSKTSLGEFLEKHGTIGIRDIDTRALVRHIRSKGSMKAVISTIDLNKESLVKKAKDSPGLIGKDLVKEVTIRDSQKSGDWDTDDSRPKVIVYDFGIKHNILRMLVSLGCKVHVVPADTLSSDVLALKPDGILFPNGPGDPEGVPYAIRNTKEIIEKGIKVQSSKSKEIKAVFGICFGHQILSLALGAKTFKLKFGHHGGNHPVKNLMTQRIEITVQNHCFAVTPDSLEKVGCVITHRNLNDGTVEGMRHSLYPIFSVQYHPEASPGPHDTNYLLREFVELMRIKD